MWRTVFCGCAIILMFGIVPANCEFDLYEWIEKNMKTSSFEKARNALKSREDRLLRDSIEIPPKDIPRDDRGKVDPLTILVRKAHLSEYDTYTINKHESYDAVGHGAFSDGILPLKVDFEKLMGPWLEAIHDVGGTNSECIVHHIIPAKTTHSKAQFPDASKAKKFAMLTLFRKKKEKNTLRFHFKTAYADNAKGTKLLLRYRGSKRAIDPVWVQSLGPVKADINGTLRYEYVILAYEGAVYKVLVRNLNAFRKLYERDVWEKLTDINVAMPDFKKKGYQGRASYTTCNYSDETYDGFGLFPENGWES